jgi:excisionase family DNA binding protein
MTTIDTEDLLTVAQAAEEKKVTRQAINHLIRQEKLPFVEIAGKRFISRKALQEFEPDKGGRPQKVKAEDGKIEQ